MSVAKRIVGTHCVGFVSFLAGLDRMEEFRSCTDSGPGDNCHCERSAFVPDFEHLSFSCLGYNEVSSDVNSVRSFFGLADVADCAFIEEKMVPSCVEAAQKFKRLQDPRRASPWYWESVRSRELLFVTHVTSIRTAEVASRYPSVDDNSRYSEGLEWRKRASPTKTVAVPVVTDCCRE